MTFRIGAAPITRTHGTGTAHVPRVTLYVCTLRINWLIMRKRLNSAPKELQGRLEAAAIIRNNKQSYSREPVAISPWIYQSTDWSILSTSLEISKLGYLERKRRLPYQRNAHCIHAGRMHVCHSDTTCSQTTNVIQGYRDLPATLISILNPL